MNWHVKMVVKHLILSIHSIFDLAFPYAFILAAIGSIVFYYRHRAEKNCLRQCLRLYTLIVYVGFLVSATLFSRTPNTYSHVINVDLYFLDVGWYSSLQTIQNIFLLVPFCFLHYWFGFKRHTVTILCIIMSLTIELIQMVSGCGTFELADIILNVAGPVLVDICIKKITKRKK